MATTQDAARQGQTIAALVSTAIAQADRVTGVSAAHRPPHLRQFTMVLREAANEARLAGEDPARVPPDADLWRLREPGYLRSIVEHPVVRVDSALMLLPVVLTWAALGYAEYRYIARYTAADPASRPPFFTDWLAQPWYLGPIIVSVVIVLTVLVLMSGYRRPAKQQAMADRLDRIAHALEADLRPPLAVLRARLGPTLTADATRMAAADLSAAAANLRTSTERLAAAMTVVDRLGQVADRLATAVPDLGAQTDRLAELDRRLTHSVGEITTQAEPMTSAVSLVADAAKSAMHAIDRSEAAMSAAGGRLDQVAAIAARTAEHQHVLARAEQPFTAAAGTIAEAAQRLEATITVVHQTATSLREVIRDVNWLVLVADGLHHSEPDADELAR